MPCQEGIDIVRVPILVHDFWQINMGRQWKVGRYNETKMLMVLDHYPEFVLYITQDAKLFDAFY